MNGFGNSVRDFLEGKGVHCEDVTPEGVVSHRLLDVRSADGKTDRKVMLLNISADTADEARRHSAEAWEAVSAICTEENGMPVMIAEDRWNSQTGMVQERLLAHLEMFFPVYARNCETRRIDKNTAAEFLKRTHSYGDAACRYRYGLFLKRHTGHIARALGGMMTGSAPETGSLIAVATFSNARKWMKGEKVIRSYEWTRYASLPGIRVTGGMGRLLKAFINDVHPDDIMSYADLEWSGGNVYETLGFRKEDHGKDPVMFTVDPVTWERKAIKPLGTAEEETRPDGTGKMFFRNFGSVKYRLKLTEYE